MNQPSVRGRVGAWWRSLPPPTVSDPFQRRLYPLLFATVFALAALDMLGLIVSLLRIAAGDAAVVAAWLYAGLVATAAGGFWLARRGAFRSAVLLIAFGLLTVQALGLLASGLVYGAIMLAAMLTSIVFAGLMLGWAGGGTVTAISVGAAALVSALEANGQLAITAARADELRSLIFGNVFVHACLAVFVLVIVVCFRNALRGELARTQAQELALRAARDSLQEQIAQQTGELRRAFEQSEERAQRLAETLGALERSEATIRQLEAPLIPVLPGVMLVPLVGHTSGERLRQVSERILTEVVARRASAVIVDVTSVHVIDTAAAQQLLELATSLRLVGARAVLVGIRPEVAQTVVALGVTLALPTFATLEQAIGSFLLRPRHAASAAS